MVDNRRVQYDPLNSVLGEQLIGGGEVELFTWYTLVTAPASPGEVGGSVLWLDPRSVLLTHKMTRVTDTWRAAGSLFADTMTDR